MGNYYKAIATMIAIVHLCVVTGGELTLFDEGLDLNRPGFPGDINL